MRFANAASLDELQDSCASLGLSPAGPRSELIALCGRLDRAGILALVPAREAEDISPIFAVRNIVTSSTLPAGHGACGCFSTVAGETRASGILLGLRATCPMLRAS